MPVQVSRLITVWDYQEFAIDRCRNAPNFKVPDLWEIQLQSPPLPVTYITAIAAGEYAAWKGTRLPTDAEWMAIRFELLDGLCIREWTSTKMKAVVDVDGELKPVVYQMVHGGPWHLRDNRGQFFEPEYSDADLGFRVVIP